MAVTPDTTPELRSAASSPPLPPFPHRSPSLAPLSHSSMSPPPSKASRSLLLPLPLPQSLVKPKTFFQKCATLSLCVIGIYVFFISYAVLQERIYKQTYGPRQQPFEHAWFLVLIQISGNIFFSGAALLVTRPPPISVPGLAFLKMSLSYIGAMLLSNWALSFMTYPAQSLAKSCKLIPVMLMRIVINHARYEVREYVQVALITSGISVFMLYQGELLGGPTLTPQTVLGLDMSWIGLLLCLLALMLDGYTGPIQERVCAEHKCTMAQLMFYLNLYSMLPLLTLLVVTGELSTGVAFTEANPRFLVEAVLFSLCSALGQSVVLFTLLTFNSLILVTVTTTRKFATILLSIFIYGHTLEWRQWAGVGLVFAGLWMDVHGAYKKHTGSGSAGAAGEVGWLDGKKQDGEEDGESVEGVRLLEKRTAEELRSGGSEAEVEAERDAALLAGVRRFTG